MKDKNYRKTGLFDNEGTELVESGETYFGHDPPKEMKTGINYISYLIPYTATTIYIEKGIRKSHLERMLQKWIITIESIKFSSEFSFQQWRTELHKDIKQVLEKVKKGVNP